MNRPTLQLIRMFLAVLEVIRHRGLGLEPEEMTRVFEKFYHSPHGSRRHAKGTGLGLFIANEIVRAHGGTIGVESSAKEGTTFSVDLPRRENA